MADDLLTGDILEESRELTLEELCAACSTEIARIIELVDEGILRPAGSETTQWRFASVSVVTVKRTMRLQQDLGVNLPGAALALELLEEIERLRDRLGVLERDSRRP